MTGVYIYVKILSDLAADLVHSGCIVMLKVIALLIIIFMCKCIDDKRAFKSRLWSISYISILLGGFSAFAAFLWRLAL